MSICCSSDRSTTPGTLLTASRTSFRLIGEFLHRSSAAAKRVVVYGAGDGGALAVRELTKPEFDEWVALARRTAWKDFAASSPKSKELLDALAQSRAQ